jgi:hypothetical protein
MRRLQFDPYEFDSWSSEESLEIVVSTPSQHRSFSSFLRDCNADATASGAIPPSWPRLAHSLLVLQHRGGIELPHLSKWRDSILIRDEWNDVEFAIAAGSILVWSHWTTSA